MRIYFSFLFFGELLTEEVGNRFKGLEENMTSVLSAEDLEVR